MDGSQPINPFLAGNYAPVDEADFDLKVTGEIPAGLNGAPLTASGLSSNINLQNTFAQYQMFPQSTQHSIYASGSQKIGADVEFSEIGRASCRERVLDHV